MDQIQTTTEVEATTEVAVGAWYDEEAETPAEDGGDIAEQGETPEMEELPVEDWDYQRPRRGEIRTGVILSIGETEIIVDVGAKRDGIVPYADMQRLGPEKLAELSEGDEVMVYVLRPEDQDGNLLLSLNLAREEKAWQRAQGLADSGEVWEGQVIGYNKGGLVIPLDEIRGFVPASQVPAFPHGLSQEERIRRLSDMVGETLMVKVIEINRRKRRLILSAKMAQRQWRKQQRERLLEELREGEVRKGIVSSLCPFGAFVDLGGADGLVHLSELSWRRVRHPREVLHVGDKVEVYVLRLDEDRKRIGLSLKRLQPEPWALVEDKYELGQLVEGVVTNVVDFGAFAEIEEGIEGLIHVSELTDAPVSHSREVTKKGDLLLLRIIRVDIRRKRLGLSLKRVLESEWAEWAARLAVAEAEAREAEAPEAGVREAEAPEAGVPETGVPEAVVEAQAEAEPEMEQPEAKVGVEAEAEPEMEEPEAELVVEVEAPETGAPEVTVPEAEMVEEIEEPEGEVPEAEVEPEIEELEAALPEAEVEPEIEELEAALPEAEVEPEIEEPEAALPEAEVPETGAVEDPALLELEVPEAGQETASVAAESHESAIAETVEPEEPEGRSELELPASEEPAASATVVEQSEEIEESAESPDAGSDKAEDSEEIVDELEPAAAGM
jgi:small subunit ribosomal protein S1